MALKFCGGCDPAYERGEYFAAIARAAGGRIQWARLEDPECVAVLLICGCLKACIEKEMPPGLPLLCLKDDSLAPEQVAALLLGKE